MQTSSQQLQRTGADQSDKRFDDIAEHDAVDGSAPQRGEPCGEDSGGTESDFAGACRHAADEPCEQGGGNRREKYAGDDLGMLQLIEYRRKIRRAERADECAEAADGKIRKKCGRCKKNDSGDCDFLQILQWNHLCVYYSTDVIQSQFLY